MIIFQIFFKLLKQKGHGYHINYEKLILKILTSQPFSRGWSLLFEISHLWRFI